MGKTNQTAKKKMNKMTVALISLAVAIFATIGAVIAVYAASIQKLSSAFDIEYSVGDNVAIAVNASSIWVADEGNALNPTEERETPFSIETTLQQDGRGLYIVNADDDNQQLKFSSGDVEIFSEGTRYLYFTIDNLTSVPIEATIVDQSIVSNMTVVYTLENKVEYSVADREFSLAADGTSTILTLDSNKANSFTVAANTCVRLIISVRVAENGANAYYRSTAEEGGISWSFTQQEAI